MKIALATLASISNDDPQFLRDFPFQRDTIQHHISQITRKPADLQYPQRVCVAMETTAI